MVAEVKHRRPVKPGRAEMPIEAQTYKAVHAVAPGKLELTEKPLTDPGVGEVRIRVEACGVCHSDSATIEGLFPINWPRVPGPDRSLRHGSHLQQPKARGRSDGRSRNRRPDAPLQRAERR